MRDGTAILAGAVVPGAAGPAVVAGIGFIGGGTVLQVKGDVKGLTTAATILMAACVGIAAGAGYFILAFSATALTVGTVLLLVPVEKLNLPADPGTTVGTRGPASKRK